MVRGDKRTVPLFFYEWIRYNYLVKKNRVLLSYLIIDYLSLKIPVRVFCYEKGRVKTIARKCRHLKSKGKYKESIEAAYNLLQRGWKIDDYKSTLTAHITNAA